MNTIHEFDAKDKSTWPDESRNGKYVLCKMNTSKNARYYEYDVCMTKLVTDRYDGIIVAWMEIPLEMKDFEKGQKHHYVDIRDAWEEFRKTGLMVFVNSFLHIFGWPYSRSIEVAENLLVHGTKGLLTGDSMRES